MADQKPWHPLAVNVIAVILSAGITAGASTVITANVTKDAVSKLEERAGRLESKVSEQTISLNKLQNKLDDSVTERLAAQERRAAASDDRANRMADTIYELRLAINTLQADLVAIRRASEAPRAGGRGGP